MRRNRRSVALVAGLAGVGLTAALLTGCSAASSSTTAYGTLPSYLPKASTTMDRTLVGTTAKPALTTEGDTVRVKLAQGGAVSGMLLGPVVPGEGLPYQPDATTATFTMTLWGASTAVPIGLDQFNLIDHLGKVYHPSFVPGQPTPPATLEPGQRVSFELRVVMVTGEGVMQWAPDAAHPSAEWDFILEDD